MQETTICTNITWTIDMRSAGMAILPSSAISASSGFRVTRSELQLHKPYRQAPPIPPGQKHQMSGRRIHHVLAIHIQHCQTAAMDSLPIGKSSSSSSSICVGQIPAEDIDATFKSDSIGIPYHLPIKHEIQQVS